MESSNEKTLSWSDFMKVEMRVGTIIEAKLFMEASSEAYKIHVDFGEMGLKKTSAQITKLYSPEELIGKQIIAVVNFHPKQIANMMSECLILGAVGDGKDIILIQPERKIQNGLKIG